MFPYEDHERVPIWALVLIAVVFPVVTIVAVGFGVRRSPYDVHNGILGLLVSVLLTTIFTQVIKVTVGKHRPDFLARFPIVAATMVAITRVMDFRHSGVDVTWGSIIGIVMAVFAYHQYYPPLTSTECQRPYPPRDFSHLIRDAHGQTQELGHLESAIGIRPNEEIVDETLPQPQIIESENRK
ncbi:hypothetical protein BG004_007682 [Podila humilis]|nr:hypothetical protein BG004_007682 [Podila humilis]